MKSIIFSFKKRKEDWRLEPMLAFLPFLFCLFVVFLFYYSWKIEENIPYYHLTVEISSFLFIGFFTYKIASWAIPHLPKSLSTFLYFLKANFLEALLSIPVAFLRCFDLTRWEPSEQFFSEKTPILFIHGYLHHSSAGIYIRHRLKKAGLGPFFSINLGSPSYGIEDYVEKIRKKSELIEKITGHKDLILIGHSMGGLIALSFAQKSEKNTHVITLASPLAGTYFAYAGIGKSAQQMRYKSSFFKTLKPKKFTCIFSENDYVIIPKKSCKPNHLVADIYTIPDAGHVGLLYNDKAADYICLDIKKKGFIHHIRSTI